MNIGEIKSNSIYCADWLTFMETMIDQNVFVNTCFTSPPYWQMRDYKHPDQLGQEPDVDEYIKNLVEGYHLLQQSLTPDGSFFLNIGDSYVYRQLQLIPARVAMALQKDGWLLRNQIIWAKLNPEPYSGKTRWATTYELVYFFVKENKTGPFWWIRLNRPEAKKKKKNYESQLAKQRIWDETVDWWGNAVIKPFEEVPERFYPVGYKLTYYFALDLIRKPHKTESINRVKRQRKYKGQSHSKGVVDGQVGVSQQILQSLNKEQPNNLKQTSLMAFNAQAVAEEILDTPDLRDLQFRKEWRHKTKRRSATHQQRLSMYHPKGAAPKDIIKTTDEEEEDEVKSARRDHSPSKFDGEVRGGMPLPPQDAKDWMNPRGKNPGDVVKIKNYEKWYNASYIPATQKTKGHGNKALPLARLASGEVEPHPLGKNPGDVIQEFEIPTNIFNLFLEWIEYQEFASDIFETSTSSFKGAHYAVFPKSLVRDPIRVTCPPNGIAFDPMCGRGTVGRVAFEEGFNFLLCDLVSNNVKMAKEYVKAGQRRLV